MATLILPSGEPICVPQELCGHICQDPSLTQSDLYTLCLVSRALRFEAERTLYTSITLPTKSKIFSFCSTILFRPHLVAHLHTLTLRMPPQRDLLVSDLEQIKNALHLCTKLTHLRVLHDGAAWMHKLAGLAMASWILEGHKFKLTTLETSYFDEYTLSALFSAHPSIQTLITESAGLRSWSSFAAFSAPNLTKLSCSAHLMWTLCKMPAASGIKLEHLHLSCLRLTAATEGSMTHLLTRYSKTLKSLSITRYQNRYGNSLEALIRQIAGHLPDIKFLRILDLTRSMYPLEISQFFPTPCHFPQLTTLILHSPMIRCTTNNDDDDNNEDNDEDNNNDDDGDDDDAFSIASSTSQPQSNDMISAYPELCTHPARLVVAERIMQTLLSLRRLVLVEKGVNKYRRDEGTGEVRLVNLEDGRVGEEDENEWPRYDGTVEFYQALWKSQWCMLDI